MKYIIIPIISLFLFIGCKSSDGGPDTISASPDQLYKSALCQAKSNPKKAIGDLLMVEKYYPMYKEMEKAKLLKMWIEYENGKFSKAGDDIDDFLYFFPSSPYLEYAMYMKALIEYSQIFYIEKDTTALINAYHFMSDIAKLYPNTKYGRDAKRKAWYCYNIIGLKELSIGKFYEKRKEYVGAISRYQNVLSKCYDENITGEALYRLVAIYIEIGAPDVAYDYYAYSIKSYNNNVWTNKIKRDLCQYLPKE